MVSVGGKELHLQWQSGNTACFVGNTPAWNQRNKVATAEETGAGHGLPFSSQTRTFSIGLTYMNGSHQHFIDREQQECSTLHLKAYHQARHFPPFWVAHWELPLLFLLYLEPLKHSPIPSGLCNKGQTAFAACLYPKSQPDFFFSVLPPHLDSHPPSPVQFPSVASSQTSDWWHSSNFPLPSNSPGCCSTKSTVFSGCKVNAEKASISVLSGAQSSLLLNNTELVKPGKFISKQSCHSRPSGQDFNLHWVANLWVWMSLRTSGENSPIQKLSCDFKSNKIFPQHSKCSWDTQNSFVWNRSHYPYDCQEISAVADLQDTFFPSLTTLLTRCCEKSLTARNRNVTPRFNFFSLP